MNLKLYSFAQQTAMPNVSPNQNKHIQNIGLENTGNNQPCPLRSWRIA
ncbi:MAG: hypothetical protein ABL933_06565 [Methyloglobulus sp.]|nr:hypothetical protein [Methyloglobulus sp.]